MILKHEIPDLSCRSPGASISFSSPFLHYLTSSSQSILCSIFLTFRKMSKELLGLTDLIEKLWPTGPRKIPFINNYMAGLLWLSAGHM